MRICKDSLATYFIYYFILLDRHSCIFDFTPLPHNSYHARSTSTRLSPSINRDSIVLGRHRKKQGRSTKSESYINGLRLNEQNKTESASPNRGASHIVDNNADQTGNIKENVAGKEPWNESLVCKPAYSPASVARVYKYLQQDQNPRISCVSFGPRNCI